jgi:hypothetical protein
MSLRYEQSCRQVLICGVCDQEGVDDLKVSPLEVLSGSREALIDLFQCCPLCTMPVTDLEDVRAAWRRFCLGPNHDIIGCYEGAALPMDWT